MRLHRVRKLVIAVVLVVLAHRPAHADCHGSPCPTWLNVVGYTFVIGATTGYAVGTGYFIRSDVTDPDQTLNYGVAEVSANGLLATVFAVGTLDTIHQHRAAALPLAGLTVLHTTLAIHGGWRIGQERGDLKFPDVPLAWIAGSAYGLETLFWLSELPRSHSRTYGITEAAVNAPLAIGLGYLAYDRFESYRGGPGLLYGGMAAVSTVFVVDGIRTAISPHRGNKLDFLPTMDGDSAGVSLAGTW